MSIKAIFYDFDGVIKESTQIKTEAFYSLYEKYGKDIAEKAKQHHIAHGGISRFEKFKYYHKTYLNIELSESEIAELAKQFSKIVLRKVIESEYVTGALESIKRISERYDQYIVTGTPQNEINQIIKELNINSFFKGIYGSPDNKITISKKIIDKAKLQTDEILFIGDATTDFNAAQHFNFKFILREHDENRDIFKEYNIIKMEDLTNLELAIENI